MADPRDYGLSGVHAFQTAVSVEAAQQKSTMERVFR